MSAEYSDLEVTFHTCQAPQSSRENGGLSAPPPPEWPLSILGVEQPDSLPSPQPLCKLSAPPQTHLPLPPQLANSTPVSSPIAARPWP